MKNPNQPPSNGNANDSAGLQDLFSRAQGNGTLSADASTLITGHLGPVVIAGAAGLDAEDIYASDVTLITLLVDESSSIGCGQLTTAVMDGQHELLDALGQSREKDSILLAQWSFHHKQKVHHAYVPVEDAVRLDDQSYRPGGSTALYDTWCDALAANVAYAQRLKDAGTPCRSVVVVITDGADVGSKRTAGACKRLSESLLASEQFVLAFVGVGDETEFKNVARSMGVPDGSILVQKKASASSIRQAFQMVSRSAIKASQGLVQPGPQAGFFA